MKKFKMIATLSFALVVFPGYSATLIPKQDAGNLHKFGVASVTGIRGDIDDTIHALNAKADKEGAEKFAITSLGTSGDSGLFHGTADVYK
ncbi:DUF1471 domain-containing protein [Chimaeribacter californicus]|nr:DUF1471 domain-containing protein [Chimaeribacter californicus]